jgi:hypothetical protein
MSSRRPVCCAIEPGLMSVAADEAGSAAGRVEAHVGTCWPRRDELTCYRKLDGTIDS